MEDGVRDSVRIGPQALWGDTVAIAVAIFSVGGSNERGG
jgi:hypothetical protein